LKKTPAGNITGNYVILPACYTVMWSEAIGLRTRPVSDQKIGLVNAFKRHLEKRGIREMDFFNDH